MSIAATVPQHSSIRAVRESWRDTARAMSQENVEMVRRFFAAFGNRQAEDLTDDALKQFFDSEVE